MDNILNWRPRNETVEDLLTEKNAALYIEKEFDCDITKLSERLYELDWAISREGKVCAFGEFKRRRFSRSKFQTLILSAAKWMKGIELARFYSVPFILFIQWDDGIFYLNSEEFQAHTLRLAGNHRGQNGDIEPCVEIPVELFKKV